MPKKALGGIDNGGQRLRGVGTPTAVDDGVPRGFIRYDLSTFANGKPDASEILMDFAAPVAFTLPAGLSGSVALASTAPSASVSLTLTRNGSSVATITFAAGATTATFTAASAVAVAVNDRLQLIAPSTQDSAFAGLTFTFAGVR